jgi:diphosphomevalonate decarboxylase
VLAIHCLSSNSIYSYSHGKLTLFRRTIKEQLPIAFDQIQKIIMQNLTASAFAHPNIAFIKYWGDKVPVLRIPANGSISMNLDSLRTRTEVTFDSSFEKDELILDGRVPREMAVERVARFLDHVRWLAGISEFARVSSENNFPTGSGIASSASAFAALSLAASTAAGIELDEGALSRLARRGSGSACRSVPGGFVEWQSGEDDESSYAFSISPPDHWELIDCIAIVSQEHKETGSQDGHLLAETSLLQDVRVADTPRRLELCRQAILNRDFEAFAEVVELDSNLMHAVMITSQPQLIYWQPATLAVMQAVGEWRKSGTPVCFTIDAGPNVHVITPGENSPRVIADLIQIPGVSEVLVSRPGSAVRLVGE